MRRRDFVIAMGASLASVSFGAIAKPRRMRKIGLLLPSTRAGYESRIEGLRSGLLARGYVEGQNIEIEFRFADNRYERLPRLAAGLVALGVEVLVTAGTPGAMATKRTTATIPIVIASISDPVATGVVASLARSGGNITGAMFFVAEVNAKRVEYLKDALPHMKRVAALTNPLNASMEPVLNQVKQAANALGVEVERFGVRAPDEFDAAFSAMAARRADAVVIIEDAMLNANAGLLGAMASAHRLPSIGLDQVAEGGGLFAFGVNQHEMFRRAAFYVDRILRGARPEELPIERSTRSELTINLRTAHALRLVLPASLTKRADRVIE